MPFGDGGVRQIIARQSRSYSKHEGRADLVGDLSYALHEESVRRQVNRSLASKHNQTKLRIQLARRPYGGVLIVISYHYYLTMLGKAYRNINASVEDWAIDANYAYVRYAKSDKLYSKTSFGWRRGEDFLWIASDSAGDPVRKTFDDANLNLCLVPDPRRPVGSRLLLNGIE